jgi:hypothetical protein
MIIESATQPEAQPQAIVALGAIALQGVPVLFQSQPEIAEEIELPVSLFVGQYSRPQEQQEREGDF